MPDTPTSKLRIWTLWQQRGYPLTGPTAPVQAVLQPEQLFIPAWNSPITGAWDTKTMYRGTTPIPLRPSLQAPGTIQNVSARCMSIHSGIISDSTMWTFTTDISTPPATQSVPYRESQFVADDYFYWLKQELGVTADVTDTGIDCNSYLARPWMHEEKYHPTNWVTDRSLDFLRRRDPRKPFFLMASYLRPHPPFDAPQYYFDLYKDKDLRPPFVGDWEDTEELMKNGRIFDSKTGPLDEELKKQAQIGYYACITHLDHQIGRLIMALIEQELYDDTLILFTSDHGEELCDHHMFRKSRPYEGSCRIPFSHCRRKECPP